MNLQPSSFQETLGLLTSTGAVLSFFWGIWVWRDKSNKELAQAKLEAAKLEFTRELEAAKLNSTREKEAESRSIEAKKPFLDRQLALYVEASQITAKIATSKDSNELAKSQQRFWELFWGELALVENNGVELAMVAFGEALRGSAPQQQLEQLSLALAHACRESLDKSWRINEWTDGLKERG
jgi:hypothetical protein